MVSSYEKRLTPVVKRMAEDMRVRNFSPRTIDIYAYHVDKFQRFFDRPVEELGPEEIRQYQLHLVETRKVSWSAFNQAVCGLRFLYQVSLGRSWFVRHIPFGKRPKKLPTVLGDEEVRLLLSCVPNPKHRTTLLLCYAAGLRLGEATRVRVEDIDGRRGMLHIHGGKGGKDRMVPLSPRTLDELRAYWKLERPTPYLFFGKTADKPLSHVVLQKACKLAVAKARITHSGVTPHTLRHSYATGLLEAGVDILTISKLLGHNSFITTMIYLHCRRPHLERTPSPLDWLPTRQCRSGSTRPATE